MNDYAELITAIAQLLWPVLLVLVIVLLRKRIMALLDSGSELIIEGFGTRFAVKPAQTQRTPKTVASDDKDLVPIDETEPLPADYYFINHTSFLRPEMQADFIQRTGFDAPHYDIRVVVDSYYRGALGRVEHVEYILHKSYEEPRRIRSQRKEKFQLKEVANGEYVLIAKVYLIDRKEPIVLQRYITLWDSGPRMTGKAK
ncbi:MAG: pYEATS domain-containing protein [Planctomycetota bacterium]